MIAAESKPPSLPKNAALYTLLQLEGKVRAAQNQQELQFLFVNETRRLVPYQQAILLSPPTPSTQSYQVRAASSVPVVDRTVPLMQWTERLIRGSAQDLDRSGHASRHGSGLSCRAQTRLEGIYSRLWIVVSSQAPRGTDPRRPVADAGPAMGGPRGADPATAQRSLCLRLACRRSDRTVVGGDGD